VIVGLDANDPGVPPPQPPRAYFGRDKLIESLVGLSENKDPFALIGAGGTRKTSIALMVLHDGHVKERFGDRRRSIRCDQSPASWDNFLHRLSEAIGASVENSKELTPLRPDFTRRGGQDGSTDCIQDTMDVDQSLPASEALTSGFAISGENQPTGEPS
jgi:hypothetical protein